MNAERVGSFFWLAVGLISLYCSFHLGLGDLWEPRSGFLPFLAACFICFMAVIVLLQSHLQKKEVQAILSNLWAGVDWHRPLIITLLALGFILVLEWLGFILSSFLLMFILFKWEEKLSWGKAILIPVVTVTCTYMFFGFILKASLPRGMLGF